MAEKFNPTDGSDYSVGYYENGSVCSRGQPIFRAGHDDGRRHTGAMLAQPGERLESAADLQAYVDKQNTSKQFIGRHVILCTDDLTVAYDRAMLVDPREPTREIPTSGVLEGEKPPIGTWYNVEEAVRKNFQRRMAAKLARTLGRDRLNGHICHGDLAKVAGIDGRRLTNDELDRTASKVETKQAKAWARQDRNSQNNTKRPAKKHTQGISF